MISFSDDFETGNLSKWTSAGARWSVGGTYKHEGSYGARGFYGSTGRDLIYTFSLPIVSGTLEFWFKFSTIGARFYLVQNPYGCLSTFDGKLYYYDGSYHIIGASGGYDWTKIRIEFIEDGTYEVYQNDDYVATVSALAFSSISGLRFRTSSNTGYMYLDDVTFEGVEGVILDPFSVETSLQSDIEVGMTLSSFSLESSLSAVPGFDVAIDSLGLESSLSAKLSGVFIEPDPLVLSSSLQASIDSTTILTVEPLVLVASLTPSVSILRELMVDPLEVLSSLFGEIDSIFDITVTPLVCPTRLKANLSDFTKKLQIIKTDDPYDEWNPEFTVVKDLERTGCGFPYHFPIIQDYSGCDALDYIFRLNPMRDPLLVDDYQEISVTGGVGPYAWEVDGDYFAFVDDETEEGSNTIYSGSLVDGPTDAIITVTDVCENERTGIIHWCDDTAEGTVEGDGKGFPPNWSFKGNWTQLSDFTYLKDPLCHAINNKLYVGTGGPGRTAEQGPHFSPNLYEYDPLTDSWSSKAAYPDSMRRIQSAVVDGILFAGLGDHYLSYTYTSIWCAYNPATDAWTTKSGPSYEINSDHGCTIASCGASIYLLAWESNNLNEAKWSAYSVGGNSWSAIGTFPGGARFDGVAVAIGDIIYIGLGSSGSVDFTDWWSFNTDSSAWTQLATFPGTGRCRASIFVFNNKIFVGCGLGYAQGGSFKDWWKYDPSTNTWVIETTYPGEAYSWVASAVVKDTAFIGLGGIGTSGQKDWWRYN